jgi:hypothetical protein
LIQDKINPIILREMRGRMRNRRTFFGLTSYAMLLGGLAGIIYASFYYSASYSQVSNLATPSIEIGPYLGKTLFSVTVILLLIMLPFSAATLAADAIAGEKERQTYEILRITPMSSQRLVWGKLGAVFVLLVLYILIALPLLVLAFLFGGVTVGEMLIATLGLLVTALAFTAWGPGSSVGPRCSLPCAVRRPRGSSRRSRPTMRRSRRSRLRTWRRSSPRRRRGSA